MAVILIACSNSNQQSLDGEYYWVSSERNELAFTIKGDKGIDSDNKKLEEHHYEAPLFSMLAPTSILLLRYNKIVYKLIDSALFSSTSWNLFTSGIPLL